MVSVRSVALLCSIYLCAAVSAEDAKTPDKNPSTPGENTHGKNKTEKAAQAKKVPIAKAQAAKVHVQAAKNSNDSIKAAHQKVVEAQRAAIEAAKKVAEATHQAAKAVGDEAQAAAAKKLEQAKQNEEAAKKEVEQRRNKLRKVAAVQAAVQRAAYMVQGNISVRENVDPQDPIERIAVLTPSGPVIVEVALTMDGKPFRTEREKLIDEMMAAADIDKDGKATWAEALETGLFTLGLVRIIDEEQRKQYVKGLDKNKDGLVDRSEARLFVTAMFRMPNFSLIGNSYRAYITRAAVGNVQTTYRGSGQGDVQALLDEDKDGVLSKREIDAAPERLKSRDADDNDLLYPQEIRGTVQPAKPNQAQVRRPDVRPRIRPMAVLLGPTVKAQTLFAILQQHYKNKDGVIEASSFSSVPKLFDILDKNNDGKVQQGEVLGLNDVKPHLELNVALGESDNKGVSVKSIVPELNRSTTKGDTASVELPGIRLTFIANLGKPRTYDYSPTATVYLTRFDKDSNGYLEKKELPESFFQQMEVWDLDRDGRVYPKEITASYALMQRPRQTLIRARAMSSNQGNSLFQALDQSGDQRLSLREMRTADECLHKYDKNQDGKIESKEIPIAMSITFAPGDAGYTYNRFQGTQPGAATKTKGVGPDWFTRMDRNGDGDVALKEFFGSKEAFDRLDTNGDGFIDPKEAKAAETKAKSADAAEAESK